MEGLAAQLRINRLERAVFFFLTANRQAPFAFFNVFLPPFSPFFNRFDTQWRWKGSSMPKLGLRTIVILLVLIMLAASAVFGVLSYLPGR